MPIIGDIFQNKPSSMANITKLNNVVSIIYHFISSFRVELKKRNSQIILLNTASNVYKSETQTAIQNLENLKEELNQVLLYKGDISITRASVA